MIGRNIRSNMAPSVQRADKQMLVVLVAVRLKVEMLTTERTVDELIHAAASGHPVQADAAAGEPAALRQFHS